MSKPCPSLTVLPLLEAVQTLVALLEPRMPHKLLHSHEKMSDVVLVALEVLRVLHKHPYRSVWFTLILCNFYPDLPSYTQIYTRLERLEHNGTCRACSRLGHLIETWHQAPDSVQMAVVDSFPLPVCRPKRAHSCKIRLASLGYGTQGSVYGFKGHVWTTPQGRVLQYRLEPAHHHDAPIARKLNTGWVAFGAPLLIGDKAYVSDTIVTPPKKNATRASKWKEEYGPLRAGIERTFSWIVRTGVRNSQIKTFNALRSRVAYAVLAHHIRFFNP